ncbi:ciliogenesis-associated TTC17-interacting protein [Scyliorhinus canicula]|uniref:ciliogenesis-associated TTC17-interacting protein n=1 Tax=Scyliorhinus canicula TaxID=7830 RepID=UPI0018F5D50C|nr:ciliogenesis-associated TTC17-interacting protein [Scyliorhinus canicula]XP_038646084.1 ciliogenesis-associated TTC17-interacting protein [Scyliorhinus canicula]
MSMSELADLPVDTITSPGGATSVERLESPELNVSMGELTHQKSLDQTEDQAPAPEDTSEEPLPTASTEAINFLTSILPEEIQKIFFRDSLVAISETGKELGEFTIMVQPIMYHATPCLSIQANSHGSIDSIPCGTSISAYLTQNLETLEQQHHEYVKLKDQPLMKKMSMKRDDDGYVVTKEVTSGQNLRLETFTYKLEEMQGFVSEASNLVLLRILAQRNKVPDNISFLSLDTEMKLFPSTYVDLGHRMMKIGKEERDVFGIERTIYAEENGPMSWQCNFLSDGHLTSRVQVGSPVTMVLTHVPHIKQIDEVDPKPVFEKKALIWEDDMQLYFKFIDRTEALKADYNSYLRHHPELRALMADFLEFLLLRKPQDVVTFAAEYFAPFSKLHTEESPFLNSNKSSPFKKQEDLN